MEHCLLILIVIFQVFLLSFSYQDPGSKKNCPISSAQELLNITFAHHQGSFSLSFIVFIICSIFILKWSVGMFSVFCLKMISWKGLNKYIFCGISFQIGLMILVIKNIQYIGTCAKCYFIYGCFFFIFYAYCFKDLWSFFIIILIYNNCMISENLPYVWRCKLVCAIIVFYN